MQEEQFIIALAAIVFGMGLAGFIFKNIFDIIKAKINRGEGSGNINPQFFKALGDFKKTTERRLANLETIVSDLEEERIRIPDSAGEIEIEPESVRSPKKDSDKGDSNLRNMLNE